MQLVGPVLAHLTTMYPQPVLVYITPMYPQVATNLHRVNTRGFRGKPHVRWEFRLKVQTPLCIPPRQMMGLLEPTQTSMT